MKAHPFSKLLVSQTCNVHHPYIAVATDDVRIKEACEKAGAEVVMTDEDIPNGTER